MDELLAYRKKCFDAMQQGSGDAYAFFGFSYWVEDASAEDINLMVQSFEHGFSAYNNDKCCYGLAECYARGIGVPKNTDKAEELFVVAYDLFFSKPVSEWSSLDMQFVGNICLSSKKKRNLPLSVNLLEKAYAADPNDDLLNTLNTAKSELEKLLQANKEYEEAKEEYSAAKSKCRHVRLRLFAPLMTALFATALVLCYFFLLSPKIYLIKGEWVTTLLDYVIFDLCFYFSCSPLIGFAVRNKALGLTKENKTVTMAGVIFVFVGAGLCVYYILSALAPSMALNSFALLPLKLGNVMLSRLLITVVSPLLATVVNIVAVVVLTIMHRYKLASASTCFGTFVIIGIALYYIAIGLFYLLKPLIKLFGIIIKVLLEKSATSGTGTSSDTENTKQKTESTEIVGKGRLVQKGIHRYIELENGKTISISTYDTFSGTAKDYNGNTYTVSGGGINYE